MDDAKRTCPEASLRYNLEKLGLDASQQRAAKKEADSGGRECH